MKCALGLLLLVFACAGQLRGQWAPQTFYNTSNGLINNRTGTVAQDKAGYMWVGTDNGICCYDGRKFTFFPGRNRRFYFAHSYATFYKQYAVLGTSGEGVALCHRNKVLFRRFKGCEQVYIIAAVALSDHSFLLATTQKNGILLVRDSVASPVKLPEAFLARITACLIVDKDSKGNIWVGTDSGLLVFPKGDLNKPFVLRGMQGKYINVLKEGRNGVMYAGAATSLYSISDTSYTPLSECRLLCRKDSASISSLETDKDHNIYIGYSYNYNNTLIRLSPDGKQTSLLLDNTNYPWDLRFDREENLWAACENGLLKISQPYIKNYLAEAGNFPIAKSGIILNDGSFLGNIGDKVYQISAEREITRKCRGKIHAGYLEQRFFQTPDGKIWITNYERFYSPQTATYRFVVGPDAVEIREQIQHNDQGPKSLNMESASSDTLGNAYFAATESGELWTYRTGRFFPVLAQKDMKPVRGLEAITCTPEGTVWAINTEMGLMELAVSRRKTQYVATVLQAIPLDSSKYWGYKKILIDKEKCIWLSTSRQKGILLFRPAANGRYTRSGSIRPEQLSSEMVRDMAADGNGNVYVGTNAGIDKVTALNNGAFQIRKGIFNNYLTGTYVYYLRISGNYLFVGTTGSIAQIRLSKFKQVKEAPAVYITGLRVNNAGLDTLLNEAGKTAYFKASENTLNFTFLSPSYTNEKEIRYKYYLEGVDQQWSEPDYNFTTTYSQLKPGKYKFQVLAQNADGIWSQPAAFAFVIRQPFYGQWWFIALMTLAIAAFLYWMYRIRIARVLAVERTRQRISKDLHDDIGSTLSSITLMNALLRKKIGTHPEEASELAGKVEETSREMIQNISDIVWSTNPGNDSIEKLQFRLQQFAGDLFEPLNISYAIHFDREIVKKELSMDLKRDLYLVIKEIMNNAAKYSRATHFDLAISATRDTLRVLASDNGIGFDTAGTVKGNGLLNIRQRVQRLQGKITLTSRAGKGTDWEFLIPL